MIEVDMDGLNKFNSNLLGVLIGSGQGGDIHRLIKTEAGQLADRVFRQLGPATEEAGQKSAESNIKNFLNSEFSERSQVEKYTVFEGRGQAHSSQGGFVWLTAGPNWLLGIDLKDYRPTASVSEALAIYYAGAKDRGRGKAYVEIGARSAKGKHQRILRLNRTRVSKSAFDGVKKIIFDRIGELRACFAFTAQKLVESKSYPKWITRHFGSLSRGKAVFNDSAMNHPTNPVIEFGAIAKGVQSNPFIVDKIARAVESQKHILVSKINKVVKGYTYNWNTGQVFREQVGKEAGEE